jgi:hypothetical protein
VTDLSTLSDDELRRLYAGPGPRRTVDPDTDYLVRTVWGEARNQGPEGQQAVAAVIKNRSRASGQGVREVVLARNQFEPWGNPQTRRQLESLSPDSDAYQSILANVSPVLDGDDPTGGATHFYAPKAQAALGRRPPAWDDGSGFDIGDHRFFRPGGGPANTAQQTSYQPETADDLSSLSDEQLMAMYQGVAAEPATGEPIEIEVNQSTNPDFLAERAAERKLPAVRDQVFGFTEGFRKPITNLARGLDAAASAVGLPNAVTSETVDGWERNRAAQEAASRLPGRAGQFVGEVLGTAPVAFLPGGVAAQGAAAGALLTNADNPLGVAVDALTGAAGAKVGDVAMRAASRAIPKSALAEVNARLTAAGVPTVGMTPKARTTRQSDVATLRSYGVNPLPGQARGGYAKNTEDIAVRAPLVGPAIVGARGRVNNNLNRAVALEALNPLGVKLPKNIPAGRKLVQFVEAEFDKVYTAATTRVPRLARDADLDAELAEIGAGKADMPPELAQTFDSIMASRLERLNKPDLSGAAVKAIHSELGTLQRQYGGREGPEAILSSMLGESAPL